MGRPTKYPEQFRRDAIELVRSSGRPIADVARSLGINEGTLWNWVRADREVDAGVVEPVDPAGGFAFDFGEPGPWSGPEMVDQFGLVQPDR